MLELADANDGNLTQGHHLIQVDASNRCRSPGSAAFCELAHHGLDSLRLRRDLRSRAPSSGRGLFTLKRELSDPRPAFLQGCDRLAL
jgi:hypothetical protein